MTYPERSAEAAQMAADLANALSRCDNWVAEESEIYAIHNAFAGYIDETLAFRKRVDEVARLLRPTFHPASTAAYNLRSIMLPDPVDPDVLLARKVAGKQLRELGCEGLAREVEAGENTKNPTYLSVLAGIKAAREADNAHT